MFQIFNTFCGKKKDQIELTSDELNDFFVNIGSKLSNICEVKSLPRISRVLNSCIFRKLMLMKLRALYLL